MTLMMMDASILFVTALGGFILLHRDYTLAPFLVQISITMVLIGLFAQGMWILSTWVPGRFGYPSPRLFLDAALCMSAWTRVFSKLGIVYSFGLPFQVWKSWTHPIV